MAARTYNPKKVAFTFLDNLITGYADGTFIVVSRNADSFGLAVGADGEGARSASADKSGTFVLTLLQSSASNDVLSEALLTDELTNLNTGPAFLKDGSGRTVAGAGEAWVKKMASVDLGKDIVGREWTIETLNLDQFVGGN